MNDVEVMRSCVKGGLWIMNLSVNYPEDQLQQVQHTHVSLLVSEDLPHHRLCHLSHANMVRLASKVDGFAVPIELSLIHI